MSLVHSVFDKDLIFQFKLSRYQKLSQISLTKKFKETSLIFNVL